MSIPTPAPDPWARLPAASRPALQRYLALLQEGNQRADLVAPASEPVLVSRHLLDSWELLQLVPAGPLTVVDVGSGAGLPGLVWALLRPELQLTLLEPRLKRALFLQATVAELGLSLPVRRDPSDVLVSRQERFDLVVGRAVAPYADWLRLARPLARAGGWVLATAGEQPPPGWAEPAALQPLGLVLEDERSYTLPGVGVHRALRLGRLADAASAPRRSARPPRRSRPPRPPRGPR
ncbi:MAG: 16S rRNA (guanine(527)-N(7))-methyltransferase RsmG [Myxococcota bacterium]|nr:16S rRNA (guanine(527)-N(7))-methyltransferase RsmG [Myxococcota bacterium]